MGGEEWGKGREREVGEGRYGKGREGDSRDRAPIYC